MVPHIVIVGSLNMDFVVRVPELPAPGETTLGSDFQMIPGGKGANQACAVGRTGGKVTQGLMIGRVGTDLFADHLKASLSAAGLDVSAVYATRSTPTGVALIWVDRNGQNSIVVAPGANHDWEPAALTGLRNMFQGARYALFQLESPIAVVKEGLNMARQMGARTILDPAPAQILTADLLANIDVLTPNETEACILLGRPPSRIDLIECRQVAGALRALGVRSVVLKLGDRGAVYFDGDTEIHQPAYPVRAVDSTAAGDVFNGALAVALAEGKSRSFAMKFASAAAAISVTRPGAQSSVPLRSEVEEFLRSRES
jgi:ribokinase